MKPKYTLRSFLLGCSSLMAASSLQAASLYWDGSTLNLNGASDGTAGTWGTDPWDDGTTPGGVAWNNSNNDTAVFAGTADTVTLGEDVTVGGLTFTAGGYSIAPGTGPYKITLGASGSITSATSGSIYTSSGSTTTISANIDNAGFLLSRVGPGNATLSGNISGSGGLTTVYGGTTTLSGSNTYTGKTSISANTTSGSSLSVSSFNSVNSPDGILPGVPSFSSSSLGAPTTVANGTIQIGTSGKQASCTLIYTGSGETTDRVINFQFNGSPRTQTIQNNGTGPLTFTSQATRGGATNGNVLLSGSAGGEFELGIPSGVNLIQKQGSGTWTLGGTSDPTSGAQVTSGTLIVDVGGTINTVGTVAVSSSSTLTVNGSLGFGATTISNTATLNGTGSLTFDIDGTTTDLVTMTGGTLTATGLTITIVPGGVSGLTESEYVLVNATGGTITGTFAGLTGAPGYELNYDTPGQVKLVSTGGGSAYDTWAGGAVFTDDDNGDGVTNGVAFLLGAADPDEVATDRLPTVTESGGGLIMTFNCLLVADRGTATLRVEHSSDLGVLDPWTATVDVVPDADDAVPDNDVTFVVDTVSAAPLNKITATIGSAAAAGGKLFGRLDATQP